MRALVLILCLTVQAFADIQFVGVMLTPSQKRFALRATEGEASRWLSIGDSIAGFTIVHYEPGNDALTLKSGTRTLTLTLPESRVRMSRNDAISGLKAVLNIPEATQLRDLLHPKIRALFKAEDLDPKHYADLTTLGVKLEITPLTDELKAALSESISIIEAHVGSRLTHGVWITTAKSASMSFVVEKEGRFYLAPSVPGATPRE
jgi:hypothetical protein